MTIAEYRYNRHIINEETQDILRLAQERAAKILDESKITAHDSVTQKFQGLMDSGMIKSFTYDGGTNVVVQLTPLVPKIEKIALSNLICQSDIRSTDIRYCRCKIPIWFNIENDKRFQKCTNEGCGDWVDTYIKNNE